MNTTVIDLVKIRCLNLGIKIRQLRVILKPISITQKNTPLLLDVVQFLF